MVTDVEVEAAEVSTTNVPLLAPAAMVMLAGTVATAVSLLDRLTVIPPAGAALFNCIVPVD